MIVNPVRTGYEITHFVAVMEDITHRKKVDVLTMTATPIPRTLNMSLVGIRDMSIIETPPKDRLAIQTNVVRFDQPRELQHAGIVVDVDLLDSAVAALNAGRPLMLYGLAGSGKSFLLNFIATHAQQYDPFTIVLDLGHSYRKLATLLRGSYIELGLRQRAVSINPFALAPTAEHLHFLHAFVKVLLEGEDGYRLNELEDREVYEARNLQFYEQYKAGTLDIDGVTADLNVNAGVVSFKAINFQADFADFVHIGGDFAFRKTHSLPGAMPAPVEAWRTPYEAMAREDQLHWTTLDDVTAAAKAFLDPVRAPRPRAEGQPAARTRRDPPC